MDFGVVLMLIVVAACAIGLVIFSNKQEKKGEISEPEVNPVPELKHDPKTDSEPKEDTAADTAPESEPEAESGPPVILIYSFEGKRGSRICRYCDGENSADSGTCQICGRVL